MKTTLVLSFAVAFIALGCANIEIDFGDCDHAAQRDASILVRDAKMVRVIVKAGDLRINGVRGIDDISATGEACASSRDRLDSIELTVHRLRDKIIIETRMPESGATMDVVIELPNSLPIEITDGSGRMEIRNVHSLDIEDGSNDIIISTVTDDVAIEDGSGEIQISRVGGDVHIEDGSDDILVSDVGGSVIIEQDGSGSITVFDVQGDFIVREDGSGSIEASDIFGDFIVERDGSGSIEYDHIRGSVSLPD